MKIRKNNKNHNHNRASFGIFVMEKKEQEFILFQKVLRERIKKLRTDRGWTLEGTEEHGWKSWRHLQRIEAGQNFTIYTLWKICNLYGIKFSELFKKL